MSDIVKVENKSLDIITKEKVLDYVKSFLTNQLQDNEIMQFVEIATAYNLNPFKKEVYCIAYGQGEKRKLSILTGYEVYLKRAERTGLLDGWKCWTVGEQKNGSLKACIEINRKDRKMPIYHEVFFSEYAQDNSIWKSKPITMIKKVAMAQGFRLSFPDDLGGIPYTADELPDEMTTQRDITPERQKNEQLQAKKAEPVKENIETLYNDFIIIVDEIGQNLLPKDGANIQRMCAEYKSGVLKPEFLINVTHYLKQQYAEILKQGV